MLVCSSSFTHSRATEHFVAQVHTNTIYRTLSHRNTSMLRFHVDAYNILSCAFRLSPLAEILSSRRKATRQSEPPLRLHWHRQIVFAAISRTFSIRRVLFSRSYHFSEAVILSSIFWYGFEIFIRIKLELLSTFRFKSFTRSDKQIV
jgi:hypothetical protein